MTTQLGAIHIIQNSIPARYSPRVQVIPCSPDRVPQLSVDILYLIAQALPRPKWVYNLALVNKQSWHYLQPALYQCEVTYEARLCEHFGSGDEPLSESEDDEPWSEAEDDETQTGDTEEIQDRCRHGLNTPLCEECGDQIAIENVTFRGDMCARFLSEAGTAHVTALHWACAKGPDGVPAGLKAIRAASVHQPSYVDGRNLLLRLMEYEGYEHSRWQWITKRIGAEIAPPLFLAVAFGNTQLCEALIKAGCNVNLLQPGECYADSCREHEPFETGILFKIHDRCSDHECEWHDSRFDACQTAGHVAVNHDRPALLKLLLEGGLDPHLGRKSLIHTAVSMGSRSATMLLLDRCPELSQRQDEATGYWTPLHRLSNSGIWWDIFSLKLIKAIASDLLQKGANLEAINRDGWGGHQGTPLQHALQRADGCFSPHENNLWTAEAFIQLGSVWELPLRPSRPSESILDHCISRATLLAYRPIRDKHVSYARLLKTIVETEQGRLNLTRSPREVFLDAFNELATRSIPLPTQYDAFATEVVGKLLLSTGITPDASLVSNWTQSMRKIQGWTAQLSIGHKRSIWEDVISDFPTSREGAEDHPNINGTPELLGLFSGTYWY